MSPQPRAALTDPSGRLAESGAHVFHRATGDGVTLRLAVWRPAGPPGGTVLLLQGRTEFLEKFIPLVTWLRDAGVCVLALDWRGQGGSERLLADPYKGHVHHFDAYLRDLDVLIAEADTLPGPRLVVGQSMGGHIALRGLAERPAWAGAAVLAAPMVGLRLPLLPRRAARAWAARALRRGRATDYAPKQGPRVRAQAVFRGNPLTSDPRAFAWTRGLLRRHPVLGLGGVTWGWIAAALESNRGLRRRATARRVRVPVTILLGARDAVVDNAPARALAARLPRAAVAAIPRARHELLAEAPAVRRRVAAGIEARALEAGLSFAPARPIWTYKGEASS